MVANVKLVVGEGSIERITTRHRWTNPERYEAFVRVFGEGNFGLVTSYDLDKTRTTGIPAEVTLIDKNLRVIGTDNTGHSAQLLLTSVFDHEDGSKFSRKELTNFMDYLETEQAKGNIGTVVNSKTSTLLEDKLTSARLAEKAGFNIAQTYHFSTSIEAEEFLANTPDQRYIVKHRFGCAGNEVMKIGWGNKSELPTDISNYIFQEELDIVDERRIIACCDEILGARTIIDRTRPWEDRQTSGRAHRAETYTPTKKEERDTLELLSAFDSTLGCIDWVSVRGENNLYVMEFNGVGTGLGSKDSPYDLNESAAEKLKSRFLE